MCKRKKQIPLSDWKPNKESFYFWNRCWDSCNWASII